MAHRRRRFCGGGAATLGTVKKTPPVGFSHPQKRPCPPTSRNRGHGLAPLGEEVQILPLTTTGDEICDRPLTAIGGKELFIRALQEAVISQKADFAVHSLKDMAAGDTNTGLCLAAVGFGESANDALVAKKKLKELPPNAVIGSCSPRRAALLRHIAPQLKVKALRGNVQTRLDKLAMGEFDAIILAAAGLKRLGLSRYIGEILPTDSFIPAVGQGLLGIECLADNKLLCEKISGINNPLNMRRAVAERAFAAAIGGDCTRPWVLMQKFTMKNV